LAPELSIGSSIGPDCGANESSLALSVLLRKKSLLALLDDPEDNTGPSTLVLLEARWRGGGGGGGIVELRLLVRSMLCTDGGRPEIRVEGMRAGGGAGAEPDLDLGLCCS
jgi:hypothetical protein